MSDQVEKCCYENCKRKAAFGVLHSGDRQDMEYHLCSRHLGPMLECLATEDRTATVWSLETEKDVN